MKNFNKVIAAMMIMAITSAPAMAKSNVDKKPDKDKDKIEMSLMDKKGPRKHYTNHANIKTATFKVSRKAANHRNVEAAAMSVRGVKFANYNHHTGRMIVKYDANKTSMRIIKRAVN